MVEWWNDGMMEWYNFMHYLSIHSLENEKPFFHYPIIPEPNIPIFHHSIIPINCERSELSSNFRGVSLKRDILTINPPRVVGI
jgi:hypothetical protein